MREIESFGKLQPGNAHMRTGRSNVVVSSKLPPRPRSRRRRRRKLPPPLRKPPPPRKPRLGRKLPQPLKISVRYLEEDGDEDPNPLMFDVEIKYLNKELHTKQLTE